MAQISDVQSWIDGRKKARSVFTAASSAFALWHSRHGDNDDELDALVVSAIVQLDGLVARAEQITQTDVDVFSP